MPFHKQPQWRVVGGAGKGGILVRESEALTSSQLANRLATGALVEEVKLNGDRLHYKLLSGTGPYAGWVSIKNKDKELVIREQRSFKPTGSIVGETAHSLQEELPNSTKGLNQNIRVSAISVSGDSINLDVPKDSTVSDLKKTLAKHWSCPPELLQVILGAETLTNADQLSSYYSEQEGELSVTVVVSLKDLFLCLEEPRPPAAQVIALRRLVELAPPHCERTMNVISKCLQSKAPTVRREAMQAILKRSGSGGEKTIDEMQALFDHGDLDVRLNAMRCWQAVLPQNKTRDDRILSTMIAYSEEDPSPDVRKAAFEMVKPILLKRGKKGDTYLVDFAQKHLKKYRNASNTFWQGLLSVDVEVANTLRADHRAIFIDVRDEWSFDASHVPNAMSMPVYETTDVTEHPAMQTLLQRPESSIVVYSDNGSLASRCRWMANRLRQHIERHRVLCLVGGLNSWKHRGLPIEGDKRFMYNGEFREDAEFFKAWGLK